MHEEKLQVKINERELKKCRSVLEEQNVPQERQERLLGLLKKSLTDDNLIESLVQTVKDERDIWGKTLDEETVGRILRGHVFESLALQGLLQ